MKMARQIKGGSSWKKREKRSINARTGLFVIVKKTFRLGYLKSAVGLSSRIPLERAEYLEVSANQTRVKTAEAQLRRTQMLQ
jgi:hypothetical protein